MFVLFYKYCVLIFANFVLVLIQNGFQSVLALPSGLR